MITGCFIIRKVPCTNDHTTHGVPVLCRTSHESKVQHRIWIIILAVAIVVSRSPNMNAHLERFFGSLKSDCLDRLILFGKKALRNAVNQYREHYHAERPHQGLDNELVVPMEQPPALNGNIESSERLGGLLRSYRRVA